jgi:GNAT superfamily N-acetyltransferase
MNKAGSPAIVINQANPEYMTNATKTGFSLRPAEEKDMPVLFELIRELATYEKILNDLTATEEILRASLFERKAAEVLMAEFNGEPAGYAMYFYNFSSFKGLPGLYLEDIYIRPQYRGKGFGKVTLARLAQIAIENNCWGMEWMVLDWNRPSIDFYESIGAANRKGWLVYRLKDDALIQLARYTSPSDPHSV